jgi:two-component system OmpR family response regulator
MRAVLLVEESVTLRKAIADVLTRNCFNVLQAATGCDALRMLESYRYRVDLCILNTELIETEGSELARQVLAEREGIRLIFFGRRPLGWEDDFLQHPFNPQVLVATANAVFDRGRVHLGAG